MELQGEGRNETQWREELAAIDKMIADAKKRHNESLNVEAQTQHVVEEATPVQAIRREGAMKVGEEQGWNKQIVGAAALLGCVGVWVAGSLFEAM